MSVRITCPSCGTDFPAEAGLVEGDAKRLGAVLAGMEPVLGRAALQYLHLFKPAKTSLRLARAVRLLAELADLADAGTVCRDERAGVRRPATAELWAAGIEQMLMQRDRLVLPLANHNYLRQIVFGMADAADAAAERAREQALREGRRPAGPAPVVQEDALTNELRYLASQLEYGALDRVEYARRVADAKRRYGGAA